MTLDTILSQSFTTNSSIFEGSHSPKKSEPTVQMEQPSEIMKFRESEFVFKVNEEPQGLFFLKSGCVKIITQRDQTRGRLARAEHISKLVGPGEFFGFKALLKGSTYTFSAKTAKPSEIYFYRKEVLAGVLNGPNNIFKMVLVQALNDLEQLDNTNKLHYLASVHERIAQQLLEIGDRFGVPTKEGLSISLKMTRSELAQLAGTINESLSRHLTELKNEGIIDLRGREIIIKNRAALAEKV